MRYNKLNIKKNDSVGLTKVQQDDRRFQIKERKKTFLVFKKNKFWIICASFFGGGGFLKKKKKILLFLLLISVSEAVSEIRKLGIYCVILRDK